MRIAEHESGVLIDYRWESWGEWLDWLDAGRAQAVAGKISQTELQGCYGGSDFKGVMELARRGWESMAAEAEKYRSAIFEALASVIEIPYPVADIEGGAIDVGAYLQGVPECWLRHESRTVEGTGPIVKIACNFGISSGVRGEAYKIRGAAISAVIEALEFSGRRVEVEAHKATTVRSGGAPYFEARVMVKRADQPLDAARLYFACASPLMQRVFAFLMYDLTSRDDRVIAQTVARCPIPVDVRNKAGIDIYLTAAHLDRVDWENFEAVKAWALGLLRSQGVAITE